MEIGDAGRTHEAGGRRGGDGGRRCSGFLAIEFHADVVQHAVDELAVRFEAGVVPILDAAAGDLVAALIGAFFITARFVIATVRQEFLSVDDRGLRADLRVYNRLVL